MARWFATKRPPPRKASVGTSYTARGLDSTNLKPPQLNTEAGSSQPVIIPEVVPELATPFQRQRIYARMMNDASCDVSMRAAKTPVLGAEFFMQPYSDQPIDLEISEFIQNNLFEGMSSPFLNALEDILHMYEDGYAILEKVYEEREWSPKGPSRNTRNFVMLKKLAVRPTETVKEITYDNNGGPKQVLQNAIQADKSITEKKLPIEKIMIFTFNRKGGELSGKSLLRTAYPHWYYKTHLYKIDSIQKERHSLGIPRGKLLPGANAQDHTILRDLLRNLRTNEESFVIENPSIEISFVEFRGDLPDVMQSVSHHNNMIMLNVLAQFVTLGIEGSSGGRATAGTGSDLFMKSLRFVANYIAQVVNMYLIPELVVWNYPTKNFPKLQVRNIGETRDLQMLAGALSNLLAQGGITPDTPTENWMRQVFDMPAKQVLAGAGVGGPQPAPAPAPNGNGNGAIQKGDVKLKPGDAGFVGKPPNATA